MSKKNFIALADAIKRFNKEALEQDQFNAVQILALGAFCQTQNPNFKGQRWLDYIAGKCGPNGGRL